MQIKLEWFHSGATKLVYPSPFHFISQVIFESFYVTAVLSLLLLRYWIFQTICLETVFSVWQSILSDEKCNIFANSTFISSIMLKHSRAEYLKWYFICFQWSFPWEDLDNLFWQRFIYLFWKRSLLAETKFSLK